MQPIISSLSMLLAWLFAGVALLAFAAIGAALRKLILGESKIFFSFENIIFGLSLSVSFWAIGITSGLTMLLPIPMLLGLALWLEKRGKSQQERHYSFWSKQLPFAAFALFLFGCFYIQAFVSFQPNFIKYPSGDWAFYPRLARHLFTAHAENHLLDLAVDTKCIWQPYHWGDIWLLSFLAKASQLSEEVVEIMCVFPMLSMLFSLGLFELFETSWKGRKSLLWILCLAAPFIASFAWLFPQKIFPHSGLLSSSVAQYSKLLLPGCMLLWVLLAAKSKSDNVVVLSALIAALFYIGILPALAITSLIFCFRRGWKKWPLSWATSLLIIATGAWLGWLLSHSQSKTIYLPVISKSIQGYAPSLTVIYLAATSVLTALPYLLVLAAFLFWNRKQGHILSRNKSLEFLLVFFVMGGAFTWVFGYRINSDSRQFFENAFMIALPVFALYCAELFQQKDRNIFLGILSLLIAFNVLQNAKLERAAFLTDKIAISDYSSIQKMLEKRNKNLPLKTLVLKSPINPNSVGTRHSTVFYPLEFLSLIDKTYTAASLNPIFLPDIDSTAVNASESLQLKWTTPLMQFASKHLESISQPEEIIAAFAEKEKPDLLIVANDATIPSSLKPLLSADSIQLSSKPFRIFRLSYGRN
ncbi:MAG: hypothetical protein ABI169_10150 [Chitinophagaceae bacterium]